MIVGIVVCAFIAFVAMWLSTLQTVIGAPIIGLFGGIILANFLPKHFLSTAGRGIAFSSKYLLKAGIVLAGGTLSFQAIIGVGLSSLPLIIFNICLSFFIAALVGRALRVTANTSILVGGGIAICGGTAIATLSPIVEAQEDETAYAMTSIFLFDILAALLWPYVAVALGMTAEQYGILGGLAICDTSSVTAAGATFDALIGTTATEALHNAAMTGGSMAVVVKLTRTVMLVFVVIVVMLYKALQSKGSAVNARHAKQLGGKQILKAFPLFILFFLIMALLNTFINFSDVAIGSINLNDVLSRANKYLITVSLVGIGCKIKLKEMLTKGIRSALLGGCAWLAISFSTLAYIWIFL